MTKILILFFLLSSFASAKVVVKVRGYNFAPFVNISPDGDVSGATISILNELNKIQSKFDFKFYKTSAKRRYNHFDNKEIDLIFFEDKSWGWDKYEVEQSKRFASGGEVFIAKKEYNRDQSYFQNLKTKKIIGVLGFHYSFAGYEANENILKRRFSMLLTSSPRSIVDLIIKGRGDVGIITESLLRRQLKEIPSLKSQILVSTKYDQRYEHKVLIGINSPISKSELNSYIDILKANGALKTILDNHGIKLY